MTSPKALLIVTILFLSLGCGFCQGQDLPDAPDASWTNKLFLGEAGADAGAIMFDGITSFRAFGLGCVEIESPSLYGTNPTKTRFYGVAFAIEGGKLIADRVLAKSRHRFLRLAGRAILDEDTFVHTKSAIGNIGLTSHSCMPWNY